MDTDGSVTLVEGIILHVNVWAPHIKPDFALRPAYVGRSINPDLLKFTPKTKKYRKK